MNTLSSCSSSSPFTLPCKRLPVHVFFRKGKPRVILGAHSIAHKEKYVQVFPIKKVIPYPCFDRVSFEGDLQLLQVHAPPFFFFQ